MQSSETVTLDQLRSHVESALSACEFGEGCPARLAQAMRYALLAPGKRLRPLLVLMAAEACHGTKASHGTVACGTVACFGPDCTIMNDVMPGAVAVEMIHAYSLIHDDLPAMDDDDLRRGRPTVHIEFDEATAILAGDALQAEAFRHLSQQVADPSLAIKAVRVLSEASGASHLVGGQVEDLAAENDPFDGSMRTDDDRATALAHLESIHRRKTGALFAASLDLGVVLSNGTDEARSSLKRYSQHIGLAFQVVDDLLDFTSDTETLGKRTGKDADRGKLTYPGLMGIQAATDMAVDLIERSKQEAMFFGDGSQRLVWLADYILERTH